MSNFPRPATCLVLGLVLIISVNSTEARSRKAELGFRLFTDTRLSSPPGQACVSCHSPDHYFVDPDASEPTSEGVIEGRYGSRNAPTVLYAASSPHFHFDKREGLFIGGQFVDGRAADLKAQAVQPLLNPLEMNNRDAGEVIGKVKTADYVSLFLAVYGPNSLDEPTAAFAKIADALAAFESSHELSPFQSRYDRYLEGRGQLSDQERRGRMIFESEAKGNCAACHPSRPSKGGSQRPLFTDHSYDNLGVPKNAANPFYLQDPAFNPLGSSFVDRGLGGMLEQGSELGKFKVPTLRNIEKTGPYMHNGYFKTLRGVIDFYNSRDVKPRCLDPLTPEAQALASGCWPAPEEARHVNHGELGNLRLTPQDMSDLEAFLKTLTDEPG